MFTNAQNTRIKNSSFNIITNINHFGKLHVLVACLGIFLGLLYSPLWHTMWWKNSYPVIDVTNQSVPSFSLLAALDPLHRQVAPNAILNTGGRADEVRCHPGTREEVIDIIEKFMDAKNEGSPKMLWLSGPAGAGKTAIMQTIAERSKERGLPHASFFFFRTDASRRNAAPLVATLMHQIIQIYPSLANHVAVLLSSNPLLFKMGIREQVAILLHLPFTAIYYSSATHRPIVLLIDGLDECDSENNTAQGQILQALDNLLSLEGIHFRIVVASRVEHQIVMAFKQFRSQVDSIFLDEQYSPEKDIRLFVIDEFNKIKSTHYLAHTLDHDWPADSDVDDIVTKSSGQFIYAATVMRFITHSSSSPVLSLQRIHGIGCSTKGLPFEHLDAFYSYVLDQADDLDTVKSIVACTLAGREMPTIQACMEAHHPNYSKVMVDSYVAVLAPIAQIRYGQTRHRQILPHNVLEFFHKSFSDFVQDPFRAGRFYIDLPAFSTGILPKIWPTVECDRVDSKWPIDLQRLGFKLSTVQIFARLAFVRIRRPTLEITAIFMDPVQSHSERIEYGWKATEYLTKINKHVSNANIVSSGLNLTFCAGSMTFIVRTYRWRF